MLNRLQMVTLFSHILHTSRVSLLSSFKNNLIPIETHQLNFHKLAEVNAVLAAYYDQIKITTTL